MKVERIDSIDFDKVYKISQNSVRITTKSIDKLFFLLYNRLVV